MKLHYPNAAASYILVNMVQSQTSAQHYSPLVNPVFHLILSTEQPSNHHQQGQSTLPPVPPPHKQQPSVTALNHNSLSSRRNVSPAPPAALPAELQTTPESVPLQDSWVLGSNVPLESRSVTQSHTPAQLHPKVWPVLWKGPLFDIPHTAGHVTFISLSKHCRAFIYIMQPVSR